MVMVLKYSNLLDELSENDDLREYKLSGSNCTDLKKSHHFVDNLLVKLFHNHCNSQLS